MNNNLFPNTQSNPDPYNHFRYSFTAFLSFVFAVIATVLLFPVLYRFTPAGINIPLCVAALYAVLLPALRGRYSLRRYRNRLLFIPIALCSLQFVFFNNGLLSFLNLAALIILICIQIALMTGLSKSVFGRGLFPMLIYTVFVRPFHKISAFYANVFASKNKKTKKVIGGILAGIAVTLPILAIMLLLLTSADLVFAEFITNVFSWKSLFRVIYFILLIGVFFTLTGSFMASLKERIRTKLRPAKDRADFNLTAIYILTAALMMLMVSFSVIQLLYMTGISELPYDFDYSTYARQGFFQMVAAAGIDFAVIAVCHRRTKHTEGYHRVFLNVIYTILSATVIILLISAFSRMVLYEQAYRFTRLRIYTQAFMILLSVITVFTVIKIWKPGFRLFRAVFITVLSSLILLTYFNVDAFIAKDAIAHAKAEGKDPDIAYLSTLSVDALPYYSDYINPSVFRLTDPYDTYNVYLHEEEFFSQKYEEYTDAANLAHRIDNTMTKIGKEDLRTFNITRRKLKNTFPEKITAEAQKMIRREHQ